MHLKDGEPVFCDLCVPSAKFLCIAGTLYQYAHVCVCVVVVSSLSRVPTLCDPMDCSLPGSSIRGQEYRSGLPCPSPGDLPNPGIKLMSPALQVNSLPYICVYIWLIVLV